MVTAHYLQCVLCGRRYEDDQLHYSCPHCGEAGTLDILYDYDSLRASLDRDGLKHDFTTNAWRYRDLLPIASDGPVPPLSLSVGWTPLYDAPRVADVLGVKQVSLKDDGRNPTGSLKDRASALVTARAMAANIPIVSTASTGNAAAALAGIVASVPDMQAVIFVPATAPEAKIAQLLVYGAHIVLVEDSYDVAFDLCMQTCLEQNWYSRNTGVNPYTTEGKKTVALELAEQLNWQVPDAVVVSVGDGSIISGIYKGFWDLYQLGWIERMPRIIGVQAVGSSPLVAAWETNTPGEAMLPVEAHTIADSISAGLPRDRVKALRAVRETGGAYVAVSDEDIVAAIPELAQLSGVFVEPAAAAAFAGARIAVQSHHINPDDHIALVLTGNGLKDVRTAQKSVQPVASVAPNMEAVRDHLRKQSLI
ncbi:MAG: threonine synthase [Anaerolineae bacterium]|nr:threonine synthase [Anaerolineae bacterium]